MRLSFYNMRTFNLEQSEQKLREKARTKKGISKEELYDIIAQTQLSIKELSEHIGLSARTIQLKNLKKTLPFNASEKALLIANVYNKGYHVFGDREKFICWTRQENAAVPAYILIPGWNVSEPYQFYKKETMEFGTRFLKENCHFVLKVPSAVVKNEYNFLLNPNHPDIKRCVIEKIEPFIFNGRIGG